MPWRYLGTAPIFNHYGKDVEKIQAVFSNPAVLKVFALQCDLFSLAKVYVYDKDDNLKKRDPALKRFANPNPLQMDAQFLWDYMFWKMLGNAYLYMSSNVVERENAPMYWLENHKIDWPLALDKEKDKLILSESKLNELKKLEITYKYDDGTSIKIPLSKIVCFNDLTNGVGNWFKGYSRLDALYKVISNSEASLDSKNINVRYAGKFLVAGTQDPNDVTRTPMSNDEKLSIEQKVDGEKQVHAIKSMVDIKRFVSDLRVLELDKSYLADYFVIGSMYNIPKDILEAYANGSTYENQEKAIGRHISYTMEPAGEALGAGIGKMWGYEDKYICLSWDHLPFNQVFEKDRVQVQQTKANVLNTLLRAGVKLEEINIFLDTNFSELTPPEPKNPTA